MWRVVCVGPGPMDRIRRVCDRGPLQPDKARVDALATYLRSTGLYEWVRVEGASVKPVAGAEVAGLSRESGRTAGSRQGKSLDELSSMIDG